MGSRAHVVFAVDPVWAYDEFQFYGICKCEHPVYDQEYPGGYVFLLYGFLLYYSESVVEGVFFSCVIMFLRTFYILVCY